METRFAHVLFQEYTTSGLRCPIRGILALLLDGCADQTAPLGPRAIVIADGGIAQQIGEYVPGMAATLPDATIGNDLFVRSDALTLIQSLQFFNRLEGTVLTHSHAPRNIGSSGNMSSALRSLLRQV